MQADSKRPVGSGAKLWFPRSVGVRVLVTKYTSQPCYIRGNVSFGDYPPDWMDDGIDTDFESFMFTGPSTDGLETENGAES